MASGFAPDIKKIVEEKGSRNAAPFFFCARLNFTRD
jgi:hypothetical protein